MSEGDQAVQPLEDDEPEETPGYKPPAQKSLDEIKNLDADDESLVRYKQALLAGAEATSAAAGGPNVVVEQLSFVALPEAEGREARPPLHRSLIGDITKLKDKPIVIKEGAPYRVKITFKVNHEIVSGLKLHQVVFRKGIRVEKQGFMVGSYGPRAESHEYMTPREEAPKGMISRGHYTVKSKFVDDDKVVYLEWEWSFDVKRDWE